MPVNERDCVPSHLKRITVPCRVGIGNCHIDPLQAASAVPKALRQQEERMGRAQIERETGFTVAQLKAAWSDAPKRDKELVI